MERTSLCVACTYYGVDPVSLCVDPACRSKDEADRLCVLHRARCAEGYCVWCGRREPWVSPWPKSDIGCCELCFRVVFGSEQGDWAVPELARQRSRAAVRRPGLRLAAVSPRARGRAKRGSRSFRALPIGSSPLEV